MLRPACFCHVDTAFLTATISSEGGALAKRAAACGAPEKEHLPTLHGSFYQARVPASFPFSLCAAMRLACQGAGCIRGLPRFPVSALHSGKLHQKATRLTKRHGPHRSPEGSAYRYIGRSRLGIRLARMAGIAAALLTAARCQRGMPRRCRWNQDCPRAAWRTFHWDRRGTWSPNPL